MNEPPEPLKPENDLVYYDGRLIPASRALAFAQEDACSAPAETFYPRHVPKPTPVSEWDRQGLDLNARFTSFRNEVHARRQLLDLLRTIQTAKQVAEIAEQQAKHNTRTQLLTVLRAMQTAKQNAEIARRDAEIVRLAGWGIPKGPVFTFDQLFSDPPDWFGRRYEKPFIKWAGENGYPKDLLTKREITRIGYERLLAKAQEKRSADNLLAVRRKRGKAVLLADPPLEPNKRRSTPESNPVKQKK